MQVFYHMNMWVFLCIKTSNLIYELELTLALEPVRFKKVQPGFQRPRLLEALCQHVLL